MRTVDRLFNVFDSLAKQSCYGGEQERESVAMRVSRVKRV